MVTSIVMLSTQMLNNKMRSSTLYINNYAQKKMDRFGFRRKLHDPKLF